MRAEFHIHTVYSDGALTVDQILDIVDGKIDLISITDHDTLMGSLECFKKSLKRKTKAIIGVEITTSLNNESVHILGYFNYNKNLVELEKILEETRNKRFERLLKIKELLKMHFNIKLDIESFSSSRSISRGSIARKIRENYPYTQDQIFKNFIGEDCCCYVPLVKFSPAEASDLIKKFNGISILAHPTLLVKNDYKYLASLCDGIEAIYPMNKENEEDIYKEYAKAHNLLITAGNDFHFFFDKQHGNLLQLYLDGEDLEKFIDKLIEKRD